MNDLLESSALHASTSNDNTRNRASLDHENMICTRFVCIFIHTERTRGRELKPNLPFIGAATLACVALLTAACTRNNSQSQPTAQNRVLTAPTGASVVAEPEDGQWTMPAKNYASTRFSGLEDINTANVTNLKLAWSFSTGVVRGHEAAPIVVNNTMYVITPYPNIVYALDLTQPDVVRAGSRMLRRR
jgi:glucose dehydrogenase